MGVDQAFSRRRFLATGGAAAAASMGLGPLTSAGVGGRAAIPRRRIGIQLFTVRTLAEVDLPGTLALLAEIGYREIEVAGLFDRTPAQFRRLLDANRLRAIGGHQLVGPALVPFFGARTVERARRGRSARAAVCRDGGITIPTGIVDGVGEPQTADRYRELAELANSGARPRGRAGCAPICTCTTGSSEPTRKTGESLFQILLDETDPRLVWFEPDLFWMVFEGIDPLDWIPDYQHRFPLFHVKDGKPNPAGGYFNPGFTDLGEGSIDFGASSRPSSTRTAHHYIVERDDQPNPARTARVGYEYLELRAGKRRGGRTAATDVASTAAVNHKVVPTVSATATATSTAVAARCPR